MTRPNTIQQDSRVADLERHHKAALDARRPFEGTWTLTMAFGLGYQWVRVDPSGRIYDVVDGGEHQSMDNRMRPASRTNIARITKSDPVWQGVPKDRSDEEVGRARIREITFTHYWRELEMRRRFRLALWYREHCGNAFLKATWDKSKGDTFTLMAYKGGGVMLDALQRPVTPDAFSRFTLTDQQRSELADVIEQREVTTGDVSVALKTPWEIAVDPLATDEGLSTAEYIVESAIYSPGWIREQFNYDGPLDENAAIMSGSLEARYPGMNGYPENSRNTRGEPNRRGCRLIELWSVKPFEAGAVHCVWLPEQTVLLEEANPYPFLPYAHLAGLPAGRFWADAPLKDVVPLQVDLNMSKSQVQENARRFGNPALMYSWESANPGDGGAADWEGLPGEHIVYHDMGTPGSIPAYLQPPQMPNYALELPDQATAAIGVQTAQNDVSQGNVPDGVTAAAAISQLMEANDTQLGPDIADMADSLLDLGKKVLWIVRTFVKNDRLARIAGDDSEWDIQSFRGEQIGGAEGDEVQIGSLRSTSVAAKQSAIQWVLNTFIQNGQAPPSRELRRIFSDYEVGGLEHLFSSVAKSQRQVVEEHRRMIQSSQALPTNPYDDDQVHLEEHQDFQRGARYGVLNPVQQAAIEQHVVEHRTKLQNAANNQAAAAMVQESAAAGGGSPLDPHALASVDGPNTAIPSPQPSLNGAAPQ